MSHIFSSRCSCCSQQTFNKCFICFTTCVTKSATKKVSQKGVFTNSPRYINLICKTHLKLARGKISDENMCEGINVRNEKLQSISGEKAWLLSKFLSWISRRFRNHWFVLYFNEEKSTGSVFVLSEEWTVHKDSSLNKYPLPKPRIGKYMFFMH